MNRLWNLSLITLVLSCWASAVFAGPIQCQPSNQRVAILDSAIECKTASGPGNLNGSDQVSSYFGGTWTKEGELTGNGTQGYLTINLTSGNWGDNEDIEGEWFIDSSFWTKYGMAVIGMHVGNGNGNPDHFAWKIETGKTFGTFSYDDLDGEGGGLSNLFLWGSGVPTTPTNFPLPEPGMGMLMMIGLFAVFFTRRRAWF